MCCRTSTCARTPPCAVASCRSIPAPGCCGSSATPASTSCAAPASRRRGDVELETLPAVSGQLPDVLVDRAEARALLGDIHRLPDRQKSVLVMSALDGLSHEEVAVRLDTTVDTTRSLLARARENLRQTAQARETACSRCATRSTRPPPAACARARSPAGTCGRCGECRAYQRDLLRDRPSRLRRLAGWSPWAVRRPAARRRRRRHRAEGRGRRVLRAGRRRRRGDRAGRRAPRDRRSPPRRSRCVTPERHRRGGQARAPRAARRRAASR